MMTPEGRVKSAIKERLMKVGAYQFWPVQHGFGKRGIDCYVSWRGLFLAIEAKRPGGTPTDAQKRTLADIRDAGGYTCVEDSETCKNLDAILAHMARDDRMGLSDGLRLSAKQNDHPRAVACAKKDCEILP